MRNNTGNPVEPDGSGDPRDLYDNSEIIDKLVNGTELTLLGRLGKMLKTWSGMMADFTAMMSGFGYEPNHLVYVDGQPLQVDRTTQLIDYNGAVYRAKMPADFPLTLTGSWGSDSSKLVDVGDQALRAQLASEDGAKTLVGGALFKGESLDPGTEAEGTSVTRGFSHGYYPTKGGALRVGGSDLVPLNDERGYWVNLPSQNAWGDMANIGLYSQSFGRNGCAYKEYSTTFGHDCVTLGTASMAGGAGSATGNPGDIDNPFAGYCSIAWGKNVLAAGQKCAAIGEEHIINTRAAMGFGYSISSQPSGTTAEPIGAIGAGRNIALLGQALGIGSFISAADTMVIGSGIDVGNPLTGQPGELSLGANSTIPAIRVEGPGVVGAPSKVGINNNRDLNHSVDVDIPPGGDVAITIDGTGSGTVRLMGLKFDGSELPIADIVWFSGSDTTSTGGLSVRMLGRSTNAFVIDGNGSIMLPEIKTSANVSGSPIGTIYRDVSTGALSIVS